MTRPTTLKRVAHLRAGGTPAVDDPKLWDDDGGVEWVSIGDMTRSRIVRNGTRRVSERGMAQKRLPIGSPGTVLFAMYASLGAVAVLGVEATWNQAILGVQARDGVADNRFIAYWLEHLARDLSALARSNTQDNLNAEQVANLPFPTLAVEDQRRIADFLDAETARIDALIEKKQQQVFALRERLAVEASAATRMRLLGAPLPDGDTSNGWKILRLRRCFSTMDYGIGEAVAQSGQYPVLGMGNVGEGRVVGEPIGYVSDVDPSLLLKPRDLLFNRTNSLALVGKVAIFEGEEASTTFASYLVRLRTTDLAEPEYLRYALNTPEFLGFARSNALPSVGQANLNPARYGSIFIPLPPRDEQQRVTADLDRRRGAVDDVCSRLERQIELLREHRQALITAAVTGRLDVTKAAA